MIYDFDELPDRKSTESVKWHYYEEDVLPMWVADMDFVSPQPVIRALQERAAHGVFGYPGDITGLKDLIVERLARLYQWQVAQEEIVFVPGVVTGVNTAASAMVGEGGGVFINPPVYPPFFKVAQNAGGIRQEVELVLRPDGSYEMDFDEFEAAISRQKGMFLLCNPHNPVGRVFTRVELERMVEICLRHNVPICSDEIHCDLLYPGHLHVPIASLAPEVGQRTITLMAPSKTFNIAGLAASFAVIPNPELRRQFIHAAGGMWHGVNLMGLVAMQAAYAEGQEWLDQLLAYLEGNRNLLYEFANQRLPGVRMSLPEGTYLAWLDCREANLEGSPADFFREQARVAVQNGKEFGQSGEGFVRLNFGCPRPMLLEALERMEQAMALVRQH